MWIVLFVVFLDSLGFGMISPILPLYATKIGAGPELITLCIALYGGCQFLSASILGRFSDIYGRKPVMVVSLLGSVVGYVMLARAENIMDIALSRIVSGAMAGNFSTIQAYIADRTSESERAKYMGYFGAAMGLGFVVGPVVGCWFGGDSFENVNFVLSGLVAAALSSIAMLGVVLFVKESIPVELHCDKKDRLQDASRFSFLALIKRRLLFKIILCGVFYQIASGLCEAIFPLWAIDLDLIRSPVDMLPIFLASGLSFVFVQTYLIEPLVETFSDKCLLLFSSAILTVTTYFVTVAGDHTNTLWVIVLFALMSCCAAVILTCTHTLVSRCANASERGAILGVFGSLSTLGRTLATILSGVLYGQVHFHSPYYAAILMGGLLFLIASRLDALVPSERQ